MDEKLDEIIECANEIRNHVKIIQIVLQQVVENFEDPACLLPLAQILNQDAQRLCDNLEDYDIQSFKIPLELQT